MTLKEIANLAGVSAATVSYVLNNSAQVSEKTRQRVLEIVKETGYTSNSLAKSLRVNKTKTIGIIVEDLTVLHIPNIIDGINEFAEEHGYKTVLSNLRFLSKIESKFESIAEYKGEINSVKNILLGMQVDGIIYIGMHDRYLENIFEPCKKPIVYCYCYSTNPDDVSVNYNNIDASYRLTKQLIELGHTRIGVITGRTDSYPSSMRMIGFQKALEEANIPFDMNYVRNGNWSYHQGKESAEELFHQKELPTAIFAMNDNMALGVYDAASEYGLNIPKDISIVGFDNAECARYVSPRLSTVKLPLKEMGNRSIDLLIQMINEEKLQNRNICMPCEVILRSSVTKYEPDKV